MISTKGRYVLRVMIDLAEHGQENAVALKEIAQRQEISKKYLEILVKTMVSGGLIVGTGGKGGEDLARGAAMPEVRQSRASGRHAVW